MDNLPQQLPDVPAVAQPPAVTASAPQPVSSAGASDPKLLQADAVEQIEAAILQTTTSPAERALQVHAIKAAYLKARYSIESNGTMQ